MVEFLLGKNILAALAKRIQMVVINEYDARRPGLANRAPYFVEDLKRCVRLIHLFLVDGFHEFCKPDHMYTLFFSVS